MSRSFKIILSLFVVSSLLSCDSSTILKDNYDIPDAKWFIKDTPTFTFEITDISVPYNVFYNVRNNRDYLYHNLYMTHYLTDEKGKIIHQHLDEIVLFDPVTGKPMGEGLGDIYDHKVLAFKDFKFAQKGKFKIQIRQYMRQNPLVDIISAGVSVEKAVK